ncbi:MAG TPA: FAD binding domain-containing protein [Anaerolineaceae bacterium]|nr:FAD binding domain-containing protein [Anaerolineaceae bacterium]
MDSHSHANEMTNSHLLVQNFDYMEASTIEEALAWLNQYPGKARLIAGGTDLIVMMKMERVKPEVVINISKIPALNEVKERPDGSISIGALTTIHALAAHPLVRTCYPSLAEACRSFGSTQVEVMGTIGGNICNGSPAADTPPALLALCAEVTLVSQTGKRFLPLEQFFLGPGKTVLQPGEMLVEVTLPAPQPGSTSVFLKATRVVADLAKASLALSITRQGERISSCRVAMGSVAPTPLLLPSVADVLVGRIFSTELLAEAGQLIAESISPIDDVRSSAWYRRRIANVMLQDALTLAWERAVERPSHTGWKNPARNGQKPFVYTPSQKSGERQQIELNVNGRKTRVWVAANELLLNVLREKLELTGSKYACGIGECGACTVQIDGKPMLSCLILAVSSVGKEITTIEGLQDLQTAALDPLQEAFIDNTAFQCGYCTPGILMTTKALLSEMPKPSEDEVRHYLRGNTCRCTGYASIVRAVLDAAEKIGS